VAHFQHPRDLGHWHAAFVGSSDCVISFDAQSIGFLVECLFAPGVLLGKCRQASLRLGCLPLASGDLVIVGSFPATRLAEIDQMIFVHRAPRVPVIALRGAVIESSPDEHSDAARCVRSPSRAESCLMQSDSSVCGIGLLALGCAIGYEADRLPCRRS
jgi:hypothetical protein